MVKIITVAQQKGGAGKTTLAAHVAVSLMQTGKRVGLLDIDPQGSLTAWYNLRERKYGKGFTGITFLTGAGWRLGTIISQAKNDYDYLVIDSPPHTETESKAAIRAADLVLIPMQPSPTDAWATKSTLEFALSENKLTKIVLNRYNPNSVIGKKIISNLDNKLESHLGNRVAFSSCFMQGSCVTEIDPHSAAANEIKLITDEILLLLKVKNKAKEEQLVEA
jgi:chromosome partitioning protein